MGKEFWTAVLDTAIALILYFTGKYLAPEIFKDVKFFILAVQPLILALIASGSWSGWKSAFGRCVCGKQWMAHKAIDAP